VSNIRDLIGADRMLLGSDWPHPEGLASPYEWAADFASITPAERRMCLRDNMRALSGFPL